MKHLIEKRIKQSEGIIEGWADIEVEEIEDSNSFGHFKRGELYAIKEEIIFLNSLLSKIK